MAQPPSLRNGAPPMRGSTNRGFASTDPERQPGFRGRRDPPEADAPLEPSLEDAPEGVGESPAPSRRTR